MGEHEHSQPDFGTGQKALGIYIAGIIGCTILTLISFWVVMASGYAKLTIFAIIYSSACIQFLVQLICFLRLNVKTQQSRTNVISFIFTCVILTSIIVGSLWIMYNLNYNMMH